MFTHPILFTNKYQPISTTRLIKSDLNSNNKHEDFKKPHSNFTDNNHLNRSIDFCTPKRSHSQQHSKHVATTPNWSSDFPSTEPIKFNTGTSNNKPIGPSRSDIATSKVFTGSSKPPQPKKSKWIITDLKSESDDSEFINDISTDNSDTSLSHSDDSEYVPDVTELIDDLVMDAYSHETISDYTEQLLANIPRLVTMLEHIACDHQKLKLTEQYVSFMKMDPYSQEWINQKTQINKLYLEYRILRPSFLDAPGPSLDHNDYDNNNNNNKYCDIDRIDSLVTTRAIKQCLYKKSQFLLKMKNDDNDEIIKLQSWIDLALKLPYDKQIPLTFDLNYVKQQLDLRIYGMDQVKEQILLFLNNRLHNPNVKGVNVALLGEPGCGKTFLCRTLADILKHPFSHISLGGIKSSSFLNGHSYTYIGAKPGRIVSSLAELQCNNGIILLDEFDKINHEIEVVSTLLHITDYTQNTEFLDNYIYDFKFDLSYIWWFFSLNEMPTSKPLADRLHVLKIPEYSRTDLKNICCRFLLPKINLNLGLIETAFTLSIDAVDSIVNTFQNIRSLEQCLKNITDKLFFMIKNQTLGSTLSFKKMIIMQIPYEITVDDARHCIDLLQTPSAILTNTMYN